MDVQLNILRKIRTVRNLEILLHSFVQKSKDLEQSNKELAQSLQASEAEKKALHEQLKVAASNFTEANEQSFRERLELSRKCDALIRERDERRWLVKDADGLTLLLDKTSLVDLHVFHHDRWEKDRLEYLLMLMDILVAPTDKVYFFDIGAYFGQYALAVNRECPRFIVHAFEANPYNFAQLQANLMLNDCLHVIEAHNACVTDVPGQTNVGLPRKGNRGGHKVGAPFSGNREGEFVVPNLVLDTQFASLQDCFIFIKMDIENSEPAALAGMMNLTKRNKVVLQIEDWGRNGLQEKLRNAGYAIVHQLEHDYFYANFPVTI